MIDREALLSEARSWVSALEESLRERATDLPDVQAALEREHAEARAAERTADSFDAWQDAVITQGAVAWVLGVIFVRFLEDNGLLASHPLGGEAWLAGPGERLREARDRQLLYFREHPVETDREYLLFVFEQVGSLPGAEEVFDREHNPLWRLGPTGEGATFLLEALRAVDAAVDSTVNALRFDFTDDQWRTRFLGDLYQDLSEDARKRFALLQTPAFVESFLLDRTLEPAIETFGLAETDLIDPTCGSGHFLLGAFERLLEHWWRADPGANAAVLAERALRQVVGVDVNAFAVAIARFRLLIAALQASGHRSLVGAPNFTLQVACGDSLLHGPRFAPTGGEVVGGGQRTLAFEKDPLAFVYETEDRELLRRLLGRPYAVVVGNPPYITVKDRALNQAYRERYSACSGKYSLSVPFFQRFFDLARAASETSEAGFVGQITANSFMKREFGKKLITEHIQYLDLTHVIDTSGAYIPGHGTPTVILLGRHRRPVRTVVRAALGIRGEPKTPEDPARGVVWSAITGHLDEPGYEDDYLSVDDMDRKLFHRHPWTLTGGGAIELKARIESAAVERLDDQADQVGICAVTGEDEVFLLPGASTVARLGLEDARPLVQGEEVRDWTIHESQLGVWPYGEDFEVLDLKDTAGFGRYLWKYRAAISKRRRFGTPMLERGLRWYEWQELYARKLQTPLTITFAFVATHNHFVLDRGGKVFKQTAPVIKLPPEAGEAEHLALLGLLSSSLACFWLKQVCQNRGSTVDDRGARQTTVPFEDFYEIGSTILKGFPVAESRPLHLASSLDRLARHYASQRPTALITDPPLEAEAWEKRRLEAERTRMQMVSLQEELDWWCYRAYGLVGDELVAADDLDVPAIRFGQRAFEIAMARRMEQGGYQTTWFQRHGTVPEPETPAEWAAEYKKLVERRIVALQSKREIRLVEKPEFKRRWNDESWHDEQKRAVRTWLLDRLEDRALWRGPPTLRSPAWLADRLRQMDGVGAVAALYTGDEHVELERLLGELLASEAVPYLAAWRYKASGLRKRRRWEQTWEKQRREDAVDSRAELGEDHPDHLDAEAIAERKRQLGDIPVPPKYAAGDFQSPVYWRLRGKLDVPKERFISVPDSSRAADAAPVYGWAGWNALERAKALAAFYLEMKDQEGWPKERLLPLLAGILEAVPWIRQWHDSEDGQEGLGDYFETFADEEARAHGTRAAALGQWRPVRKSRKRR